VLCPEGAITLAPDNLPSIDYDHCKGCLICLQECPPHAIHAVREAAG
jgi:pyruvate ferredoxin oxidoreductase gamma subunit